MTHQALLQAAAANNHAAQAAAAGLPVLNTAAAAQLSAANCSPVITTTSELTPLQLHSADTVASLHPSFQTIPGYHSLYHPGAAAAAGPSLLAAAAAGQATPAEPSTPPPQAAAGPPPPGQGQLLPPTAGLPGLTQLTQLQLAVTNEQLTLGHHSQVSTAAPHQHLLECIEPCPHGKLLILLTKIREGTSQS